MFSEQRVYCEIELYKQDLQTSDRTKNLLTLVPEDILKIIIFVITFWAVPAVRVIMCIRTVYIHHLFFTANFLVHCTQVLTALTIPHYRATALVIGWGFK